MSSLSKDKKTALPFGTFDIKSVIYGKLKINKMGICLKRIAIYCMIAYILIGLIVAKIVSP